MMTALTEADALRVQKSLFEAFTKVAMESGIWKNSLQEIIWIAGFPRPVYKTTSSGPDHDRTFECTLTIGSISFQGEPAKTKKKAERNAAMAALCKLKNATEQPSTGNIASCVNNDDVSESDDDAIDELKEEFGKLSASIKSDVAKVHSAVENLKEDGHKLSASMKNLEEAAMEAKRKKHLSSVFDIFRSNYLGFFVVLIFVLFVSSKMKVE